MGPGQMLRVGLPVEQAAPLICELLAWEPGACQEPGRSSQLLVVASPELITPPPTWKVQLILIIGAEPSLSSGDQQAAERLSHKHDLEPCLPSVPASFWEESPQPWGPGSRPALPLGVR